MTGGQVIYRPDADVRAEVDELDTLDCSDVRHDRSQSHHTAGAPAEFIILNPCCSDRGLVCRTRAAYLKNEAATIVCVVCKQEWPAGAYRFIPLPGVLPL